jgi:Fic family protein
MKFLDGLDNDIRAALLAQLRNLWTHTSTALEGNTLTLGETAFVIEEGLTVSGKPLKHHQEVVGHARAVDLLYALLAKPNIAADDLFSLHRAVQTEVVLDILHPVGAWKREPNGTHAVTPEGQQRFIDYAMPGDVPVLMAEWLALLNGNLQPEGEAAALASYADLHVAFVRVHPFFDGNGRMARLLANLPVLRAGLPPVVIPSERRREYLGLLAGCELATGQAKAGAPLLPEAELLQGFREFCRECWQASHDLVAAAKEEQGKRKM